LGRVVRAALGSPAALLALSLVVASETSARAALALGGGRHVLDRIGGIVGGGGEIGPRAGACALAFQLSGSPVGASAISRHGGLVEALFERMEEEGNASLMCSMLGTLSNLLLVEQAEGTARAWAEGAEAVERTCRKWEEGGEAGQEGEDKRQIVREARSEFRRLYKWSTG
jgi:hypothetical protein